MEYTDETFREKKIRGAEDEYLGGVLGPIIRAEVIKTNDSGGHSTVTSCLFWSPVQVGDTVEIHLYNKIEANISLHVSGLHYSKANEGLLYNDGEQEKAVGLLLQCAATYMIMLHVQLFIVQYVGC